MTTSEFSAYVESVRSASDIRKIVSEHVGLKGNMGVCPFHDDQTPSLSINVRRQYFNCFGCNAAGDVFKFVQLMDGVSFVDAVARLALMAGIPPYRGGIESKEPVVVAAAQVSMDRTPPVGEVERLWNMSTSISADPEVVQWFCYRYHCYRVDKILQLAEEWDLVRAIPPGASLPRWARSQLGTWTDSGHRVVFRLWDATGRCASLRARCVRPDTKPKSLAPAGFAVKGLVLADPLAVQLLSGVIPDWWWPHEIVISEGEPDWLVWAGQQSDVREQGPACIGVDSGSWSDAIAARIPSRADVVIRTDHDDAGDRYATTIIESLKERCILYRPGLEVAA